MRQLRWGMIGGGEGAFIGGVHRMAARLDGRYQLVAGVISDKPLTTNLADAVKLVQLAASKQRLLGVTFNYTGYPMIRHAKQLVADGLIGNLRVVQVEYPQGWLSTALEKSGQKQASWRTDPKQAGAGALGDIGSHAFQLAEFVSGAQVAEVAADVSAI